MREVSLYARTDTLTDNVLDLIPVIDRVPPMNHYEWH